MGRRACSWIAPGCGIGGEHVAKLLGVGQWSKSGGIVRHDPDWSPLQQQAIDLHRDGLTVAQIADKLEMSCPNVRDILNKYLAKSNGRHRK